MAERVQVVYQPRNQPAIGEDQVAAIYYGVGAAEEARASGCRAYLMLPIEEDGSVIIGDGRYRLGEDGRPKWLDETGKWCSADNSRFSALARILRAALSAPEEREPS